MENYKTLKLPTNIFCMKLKLNSSAFLFLFIILLTVVKNNGQAQSGLPTEIPVTYDVAATGAFQYSVPLRIPPGIKEMVPNLAITYSSQGGNGILGTGWSLSGLSTITRGVPTIFHDQWIAPIDFNLDDVLFLDGQRLFWNSATSSFLTEVKNFATIQGHGTAGNGYAYFTVEYPNGSVYEYGNTTDSRMLAQGKPEAYYWAVNKITDIHGNYMTFLYDNNSVTGEYRITDIEYGLNSTTSNDIPIHIKFTYTSRQDENSAWFSGSEVILNKLLDNILISFSNLSQANKYEFTYDQSAIHPRLVKIEELCSGGDKPEPINITWGSQSQSLSAQSLSNVAALDCVTGDFNGDGFVDIIKKSGTSSSVYINDGSGNYAQKTGANLPPVFNTGPITTWGPRGSRRDVPSRVKPSMYFDYNGDGRDDIIVIQMYNKGVAVDVPSMQLVTVPTPYYQVWLYKANGNTTTVFDPGVKLYEKVTIGVNSKNDNFNSLTHFQAGDFDGDGKSELFIAHPYNFNNLNSVADYEFFLVGEEYGAHQVFHFGYGHIDEAWYWITMEMAEMNFWLHINYNQEVLIDRYYMV